MPWVTFYPPDTNLGILKTVGFLSFSRFIQLLGCLCFALLIHDFLNHQTVKFNNKFLQIVDLFMLLCFVFFAGIFLLSFLGIETSFVYGDHRLRGGYFEGGPFGLFAAFYYMYRLSIFKFSYTWTVLLVMLLFASQSKAAFLFLIIAFVVYFLLQKKIKIKNMLLFFIAGMCMFIVIDKSLKVSEKIMLYWIDYETIEYQLATRENDNALVMGRVAAVHIVPEIVKDNILLGVGLGNYSLVRNNPQYLGVLPPVTEWDLTGLGGIINMLIEVGVIGLLLFLFPFVKTWQSSTLSTVKFHIFLVMLAQIFGVQTYFQYLWFVIGIMTVINKNPSKIFTFTDYGNLKVNSKIGAASVVLKDVPGNSTVVGLWK
jgi:hypothetical protein